MGPVKETKRVYEHMLTKINSVEVFDRDWPGLETKGFRKGNLLLALDLCSCMIVVERASGKILWSYKPFPTYVDEIHTVRMTPEGHITYFRNNGSTTLKEYGIRHSRVIEMDPRDGREVWSYQAETPGALYTPWAGSVQKLANGNYLITSNGLATEVTADKQIVWEWVNPVKMPDGSPMPFYQMLRIDESLWRPFE
jgi:hypothetical protein